MSQSNDQQQWGTKLGVILAVAGSAVGLGNFLRFPGNAAANGGGAFMIPYFIALLLVGIPICWAEWTMGQATAGRKGFHSAPGHHGDLGQGEHVARLLGTFARAAPARRVLLLHDDRVVVPELRVAVRDGRDDHHRRGRRARDRAASRSRRQDLRQGTTGSAHERLLHGGQDRSAVTFWADHVRDQHLASIFRGLSKGIETFCRYAMPAMLVCAVIVLVASPDARHSGPLRTPNRTSPPGLNFMWNPDFSGARRTSSHLARCGRARSSSACPSASGSSSTTRRTCGGTTTSCSPGSRARRRTSSPRWRWAG